MALDSYLLPKSSSERALTLRNHASREQARLGYRRSTWLLWWYYLQGMRRFTHLNLAQGTVHSHFLDSDGRIEFQGPELLSAVDRFASRISSMDLRPAVNRQANTLEMLRQRAGGQVIADACVRDGQLREIKQDFGFMLGSLGCAGLAGHLVDHPTIGLTADLEVIHPRELMPWPSQDSDWTKIRGVMRQRVVPMDFLEQRFGKKVRANYKKMEGWRVQSGQSTGGPDERGHSEQQSGGTRFNLGQTGGGVPVEGDSTMDMVLVRELWVYGPAGTIVEYCIASGKYEIDYVKLDSETAFCPIGVARCVDNGTFHGAGLCDLLFPYSRKLEQMSKTLFQNVADLDRYGVLVLPQGTFDQNNLLKEVGKGLRVLFYSNDSYDGNSRPTHLQPHNTGDVPGKTAQYAKEMMDAVNPIRDLIAEKGRIDSAAGLQFLDEQMQQMMSTAAHGTSRAFGTAYRHIVGMAGSHLMQTGAKLPVSTLTLDLAGASLGDDGSTVSFTSNPIPDASRLDFTVRDISPKSEVARKQEALAMVEAQLTDPQEFRIFAAKEGIDVAIYDDEDRAAYQTVVRNILLIFGNGSIHAEDPVVITQHSVKPDLQLRVLSAFMVGPQFAVAEASVQDEMIRYRESLLQFMGVTLPTAVPLPEDAAAFAPEAPMGMDPMAQAGPPAPAAPGAE